MENRAALFLEPSLTCCKIPACPSCGAANPRALSRCPACNAQAPGATDRRIAQVSFGSRQFPPLARLFLFIARGLLQLANRIGES